MEKINFINGQEPALSAEVLNQMQDNIENEIEGKTLLYDGVASAGDTITLNEDFTKYNFLHIVTGTETTDFGSALIASAISVNNEIDAGKIFINSGGQHQVHSAMFAVTSNTTLIIRNAVYQIIASNSTANVQNPVAVKVRKIYGTM